MALGVQRNAGRQQKCHFTGDIEIRCQRDRLQQHDLVALGRTASIMLSCILFPSIYAPSESMIFFCSVATIYPVKHTLLPDDDALLSRTDVIIRRSGSKGRSK